MNKMRTQSIALALLVSLAFSVAAIAAPSFTDQALDKGFLNPTDKVAVQEIKVVDSTSATISAISIRNLGTADGGNIAEIFIDDDSDPFTEPLESYTSLTGIRTGLLFSLNYTVPIGTTYIWIGVKIKGVDYVAGGETIQLMVRFYSGSYTSPYITDGKAEEIVEAGFEEIEDNTTSTTYFNPSDSNVVQECTFTDKDGNNNLLHIQTGSSVIVRVENLGDGEKATDIALVRVTLDIGTSSSNTGFVDWDPSSPMDFSYAAFTTAVLPNTIPDNGSIDVTVEMSAATTARDQRTIQTRVTLLVSEGEPGSEEDYVQAISSTVIHTIRDQGFEQSVDSSDTVASGVVSPGEGNELIQKVTVTDDDLNDDNVTANGIWIRNDGTAEWADIQKIVVKRTDTDTTLLTITTGIDLSAWELFAWTSTWPIDDDGSGTIAIYYQVATGVTPGRTLRPVVKIRGSENTTDYEGDEVPYPDYVELQPHGLETVINKTPPSGGTAYSGQRLLAQKIECDDQDEDADEVRINPVQIKNSASTPVTPDEITKIEVCNQVGDVLGETTDLTGINDPGGVTISTTQNNEIPDNGEMFLCLYVTFAAPEDVTAGHRLQLDTTVFFEEDGHTGSALVGGDLWTLEINHRPTCDFDYTPSTNLTYETEITFTAKDVNDEDGDDIASYSWEFSDGGPGTGTSVKHTFAAGGSVWAKLTVEDARGLTGSKQKTLEVTPPPVIPVAKFTWDPNTPGVGDEVEFTDTSTTPTGTTITSWNWDFGDDEDSDEQNPKHTYSAGGTYTISLTVTNSDAQTHAVTHDIEVSALIPTANFDYSPATADVGDTVTFEDKSAAADPATIGTWAWNFGDGTTSSEKDPTHAYDSMGTYTVSLTVTDSSEETSNAHTEQIVVGPPVMMYSYPNPASSTASIAYRVPDGATEPVLHIYNITGALVFEHDLTVGASPYVWDLDSTSGTAQPNGLYLCVVVAKNAGGSTIKSPIFKLLIAR